MELKGFKELLLKKASDNTALQQYIEFLGEDFLADTVIDALEKMGQHGQNEAKARRVNPAMNHFARTLTKKDIHILRDALSHHLSHYRAALAAGNREVADAHLERVVPLVDLAVRATKNSGGLASFKAPNPMAWEMNYTTNDRKENGEWHRDPGGWKTRASKRAAKEGARSIPNYRFFEMAPHAGHRSHEGHTFRGGYPFEEIQIGSDQDINEGKAHLYYKEVPSTDKFTPHPFDTHPINDIFDRPTSKISDDELSDFVKRSVEWKSSPDHIKASEMIKQPLLSAHQSGKGFVKPKHFYEGIKLLDQPEEARKYVYKEMRGKQQPIESSQPDLSALPEHLKQKFIKPSSEQSTQQKPAETQVEPKISSSESAKEPVKQLAQTPSDIKTPAAPKLGEVGVSKPQPTSVLAQPTKPTISAEDAQNLPAHLRAKFIKG